MRLISCFILVLFYICLKTETTARLKSTFFFFFFFFFFTNENQLDQSSAPHSLSLLVPLCLYCLVSLSFSLCVLPSPLSLYTSCLHPPAPAYPPVVSLCLSLFLCLFVSLSLSLYLCISLSVCLSKLQKRK